MTSKCLWHIQHLREGGEKDDVAALNRLDIVHKDVGKAIGELLPRNRPQRHVASVLHHLQRETDRLRKLKAENGAKTDVHGRTFSASLAICGEHSSTVFCAGFTKNKDPDIVFTVHGRLN